MTVAETPTPQPEAMSEYLRRLRWALSELPAADRDEIVAETRSHVLDRLAAGDDASTIADQLGSPESYARAFLENYQISSSLASGSAARMLTVASRLAGRGVKWAVGVLFFFLLYTLAGSLALIALLKPVFPGHVGLWIGDRTFMAGYLGNPAAGTQEYLGYWIIPLALVASWLVLRLASALLRPFLRSLSRP